jgi:cytochrome P450
MATSNPPTTPAVDLSDPDSFLDGPPHDFLAELRRTQPVYFQEMDGQPGFWAILKHADVVHVARSPEVFSASEGGVVIEDLAPESLEMMRHMLLAMDPPGHTVHRRPLAERFKQQVIGQMEGRIREICQSILARAAEQGDVELVHDVTASLPSQVVGELFGLPEEDWPRIQRWAEMSTSGQDPDLAGDGASEGGGYGATTSAAGDSADTADTGNTGDTDAAGRSGRASSEGSIAMAMYAIELAARRRQEPPRPDMTTLILESDFGGEPMSDVDFGSFFVQLVTAGNDTTKTMLSSGLLALLQHPDQMAELRADPSLIPGAVEEILRWANPLHYFRRTATRDTTIRDVEIKAGDKVAMYYTSANRDEDVFDDSPRFDIHRQPNPHLSFGIAHHFCLGAHLARLEGKVFFEELLATFPTIELTGEPRRTRSNLNNALKHLPIHLAR